MPYLTLIICAYTLFPMMGLLAINFGVYSHPYPADGMLLTLRIALSVVFLFTCFSSFRFQLRRYKLKPDIFRHSKNISIWFLIVLILISFLFFSVGIRIISGEDRGSIRVTLGVLGPLIRLTLGFLLPLLFCILMIRVNRYKRSYSHCTFLGIVFTLIVASFGAAFLSGYKASFIYITGPFIAVLLMNKRLLPLVLYLLFATVFMTLMTVYIRDVSIAQALVFLIRRAVFMTAYGDQCFAAFYKQLPSVDLGYFFYNFMGNMSNRVIPTNFLHDSLNVSTSLLCYPDQNAVTSGKSNLTVTGFSELIYLFGWLSLLPAAVMGGVFGHLLCHIKAGFYTDSEFALSIKLVLLFSVALTWLNSGSLFSLLSFFNIVYVLFSLLFYLIVRTLIKR